MRCGLVIGVQTCALPIFARGARDETLNRQWAFGGEYRKLWWILIAVLTVTFAILGVSGVEVYRKAPPIPAQVVTASGEVLMTRDDILTGQPAWQSTGGMQLGSIWGHGALIGRAHV